MVSIGKTILLESGERKIELSFEEFREIKHAVEKERRRSEVKNRLQDKVQYGSYNPALLEDVDLIEDILEAYLENLLSAQEAIAERHAMELSDAFHQYDIEILKYETEN